MSDPDHEPCPHCRFEKARCACPKGVRNPSSFPKTERQRLATLVAEAIQAHKEAT